MPKKPRLIANENTVAAYLLECETLRFSVWEARFGQQYARSIMARLENLMVCERYGQSRRFLLPIAEAAAKIRACPWELRRKQRDSETTRPRNFFRVIFDPSGFLKIGWTYPAAQIWGCDGEDMPMADEFFVGTRLQYYYCGQPVAVYEHTATGFKKARRLTAAE